ncbi:MAG: dTDP-glucose 4,6-dehydratase [Pseudomonadota bacterium]
MRILITGGAGFIGSAVVREAVKGGHEVLNLDKLTYASSLDNLQSVEGAPNYRFLKADICDTEALRSALDTFKPDTIMHLAAESHVDRSIDGPDEFIQTNIVGTFRLLECVRSYVGRASSPVRFHHVSTDEVFGSLGPTGEFTETSPYQPNSPYSSSKAASDMLVRAWAETYDLDTVVSNCSNNYGPYQFPEKLIPVVIQSTRSGTPIPIYGKGDNVRDWLFVNDHAEALLLVAEKGRTGETYNIGGRAERTNLDIVKTICALMDQRFPDADIGAHESLITYVSDRPGHDKRYAIDCTKIERELGWTPKWNLDSGLAETVDWYLANDPWLQAIKDRGFDGSRQGLKTSAVAL